MSRRRTTQGNYCLDLFERYHRYIKGTLGLLKAPFNVDEKDAYSLTDILASLNFPSTVLCN